MDWEDDNIFTSKQQTPILIYGFADGNKLFVHTFRWITTNEIPSQGLWEVHVLDHAFNLIRCMPMKAC
jgi:hypothetical protein